MPFHYIAETSVASRQLLLMAILLAVAGGWILFYGMSRNRGLAYLLVGALVLGLGAWQGLRYGQMSRDSGQWEIHATAERVSWSSPAASGEPSFDLALADIDHLEVTRHVDQSGRAADYVIVSGDRRFTLGRLSGIDLEAFAGALTGAGVETLEKEELPAKK